MNSYLKKYPTGIYAETAYWAIATLKNTEIGYDDYLEHFPNGQHAKEAERKMAEIEEDAYWERTKVRDSLGAYRGYNRQYKNGRYKSAANKRLKELRDEKKDTIIIPEKKNIQESTEKIQTVPHIIKLVDTPNTFTDPRDGQVYKTVKLRDGNIWMAQNLNFDVGEGCGFYDNDAKNGEVYGRLYTWEAAKKACPDKWSLPSDKEWKKLRELYGGRSKAYESLIKGGDSNFNALLGGLRSVRGNNFDDLGDGSGYYWTSREKSPSRVWCYDFNNYGKTLDDYDLNKSLGFSCRCLKD